ncbi:MAG TPA: NRAMP family divalent metal transporter [Kineosporiaceae bacterium]|nr:NRAMP family divalent metal transporter [Kineosporiaceae bacterium]
MASFDTTTGHVQAAVPRQNAALDPAHVGDIHGAFGTLRLGETGTSGGLSRRLRTLLAIVGPGLIVMVGDNDAGAFGTYTQAGQNYGTRLLWTMLLLVPVIYVNQEMVLRLGAVTGVGYARLILERFGRFWGVFSVINLFVLNALTIVTEFIGITLGLGYLGLPKVPGVVIATVVVIAAASTGSFQRFERVCLFLVAGSLVLVPIMFLVHPPFGQVAHDLLVPGLPGGSDQLSTVMLLVIAIVGTTVAPWQLFFQQSYIVDKRITPQYIRYEKVDLWIGIGIVILGATAMMAFTAAAFGGGPGAGGFTDAAGVAEGLGRAGGRAAGVLFAVGLIDASIIGAAAVGMSTSYAIGDVLGIRHSLHRKPSEAKAFYAVFTLLLAGSAAIVLIPGSPLGLITEGVQTLAGVLLPSLTVFLLLLCNDRAVLGPWVNSLRTNVFTTVVIAALIMLSAILTASVVYPSMGSGTILGILGSGTVLTLLAGLVLAARGIRRRLCGRAVTGTAAAGSGDRLSWRMPPLALLERPRLSASRRVTLTLMWLYVVVAMGLVVVRVAQLALGL